MSDPSTNSIKSFGLINKPLNTGNIPVDFNLKGFAFGTPNISIPAGLRITDASNQILTSVLINNNRTALNNQGSYRYDISFNLNFTDNTRFPLNLLMMKNMGSLILSNMVLKYKYIDCVQKKSIH